MQDLIDGAGSRPAGHTRAHARTLKGPRLLLCCTRYALNTSISPSSICRGDMGGSGVFAATPAQRQHSQPLARSLAATPATHLHDQLHAHLPVGRQQQLLQLLRVLQLIQRLRPATRAAHTRRRAAHSTVSVSGLGQAPIRTLLWQPRGDGQHTTLVHLTSRRKVFVFSACELAWRQLGTMTGRHVSAAPAAAAPARCIAACSSPAALLAESRPRSAIVWLLSANETTAVSARRPEKMICNQPLLLYASAGAGVLLRCTD